MGAAANLALIGECANVKHGDCFEMFALSRSFGMNTELCKRNDIINYVPYFKKSFNPIPRAVSIHGAENGPIAHLPDLLRGPEMADKAAR